MLPIADIKTFAPVRSALAWRQKEPKFLSTQSGVIRLTYLAEFFGDGGDGGDEGIPGIGIHFI